MQNDFPKSPDLLGSEGHAPDAAVPFLQKHPAVRNVADAVVLFALVNAPFWLVGTKFFMSRPLFNMDALLAFAVACVSAWGGLVVLLLVWGVDLLQSLSIGYHFHSLSEFAQTFKFAGQLQWLELWSPDILLVMAPFAVAGVVFFRLCRRRRVPLRILVGLALVACAADVLNGSATVSPLGRDAVALSLNVSGSPSMNLVVGTYRSVAGQSLYMRKIEGEEPTPTKVMAWAREHQGRNVVMVVVESLGVPVDPAIGEWLRQQLIAPEIELRWRASATTVRFNGATTHGELRDLCGLAGHYRLIDEAHARSCLPLQLAALGYSSRAMHGFSGDMFNRVTWWKTLGFSKVMFAKDFADAPRCGGAFKGVCDTYLVDMLGQQLNQRSSQFLYLLTLNTHLPISEVTLPDELAALCRRQGTPPLVCQLVAQHGELLRKLRGALVSTGQAPFVIVSGDHAPPFTVQLERTQFQPDRVPQFVLEPR